MRALLDSRVEPVALLTAPDRPAGRGRKIESNPLAGIARERGWALLQPESAKTTETIHTIAELDCDLAVVVSYGQILTRDFLETPRWGCINLHGSLLPRHRGASPVQAALLSGDTTTGVSIQEMVEALDAGPVLARHELPILPRERAPELTARLAAVGGELLADYLHNLRPTGPGPGEEQDAALATTCRKITAADGQIDWRTDAADVDRRVRAMYGWPWARTHLPNGEPLRILDGEPFADPASVEQPGTIISLDRGIWVASRTGQFRIDELQRPGKKALAADEFLRGCALRVGDILLERPKP